ncbi:MAG: DUF4364 family protein [Tissierellia bacterium]|nr:DUF4364 family protein [Tissierellia bacterium]
MSTYEIHELAQQKLILLYIIKNIKVNTETLTNFVLEHDIMNYFLVKQYIQELLKTELVYINDNILFLTETGLETYQFFSNDLSDEIKKDLKLKLHHYKKVKNKKEALGRYDLILGTPFVQLDLNEEETSIFSCSIKVSSEKEGQKLIKEWKENSEKMYQEIMNLLKGS